jgi:hypothetical protein
MATNKGDFPVQIDYDLHGLAGIRLLDAAPADAAAVTRQLGPIQAPLTREPDIVIRFVDRLQTSSQVRYLGVDDAGFTDDAFLVLRSKHKAQARVQIPFEQIGGQVQIVCETGLPAVPLLIPILNLTVLSNGALPLHASAFDYNGIGVVVTGWSKGGKTETLLAFMANGAEYIGDEWVYISGDGQRMCGIPEPIRVWDWHLQDLPRYRAQVGWDDRVRLRALKLMVRSTERMISNGVGHQSAPVRLMSRMTPLLKRQLCVDLPPEELFGQGLGILMGTPDKVFFAASHEGSDTTVLPIDPQEIARRMVFSLEEERLPLMSFYLKFRFAFPEARNELIERAEELQRERLTQVLADKEAYAIYHPYPPSIPALFDALSPLVLEEEQGR